jgi:hypothetical protein
VGAVAIALLLAIWGEWVRSLRFRPKLDVTIETKPPDCIKIQTRVETRTGLLIEPSTAYYCRLRVWNRGNVPARDVEVTLLRLHRVEGERTSEDPDFLPLSLRWSHVRETVTPAIPPGLFRHIDLCHLDNPGGKLDVPRNSFNFETEVQPTELRPGVWPTWKGAGNYRLDFVIAADNAKPVNRSVTITFTGSWTDDEAEMFAKHLVIRVVD